MRTPLRLISILLLAALPLAAENLPVLTLEEALSSAEETNIQLEMAEVELEQKLRSADAVMATFMPDISLNANVSTSVGFKPQASTGFSGLNYSIGADVTFPFRGSMITDRKTRNIQKESAVLGYETSRVTLEKGIITGYWGLAAADLSIQAAELSYDSAKRQYDSSRKMYESGMVDELTLSQAELSLYDAELQLKTLIDSKDQLMSEFRTMTGIEGDFTTEPLPEPVLLDLPSASSIFEEYSEGSIAVKSARNALSSAKNAETTQKLSAYVPSLTAAVGYSYSGAHDRDWNYNTSGNGLSGRINLSLPISALVPTSSEDIAIKEAGDNVTLAALSLQSTKDTLLYDIQSYVMSIEQAEKSLELAEKSKSAAERTNALAEEAFQAGLMSADDASDNRNRLLSAEMNLLSARLTHLLQSYNLASAINIPLSDLQARYARI